MAVTAAGRGEGAGRGRFTNIRAWAPAAMKHHRSRPGPGGTGAVPPHRTGCHRDSVAVTVTLPVTTVTNLQVKDTSPNSDSDSDSGCVIR